MAKRGPNFTPSKHPRDKNGRFAKKGGGSSGGTVALRTVRQGIRVPRVYTADTRLSITTGGGGGRPPAIRRANSSGSARGLAIAGAAAVAGVSVYAANKAHKKRQAHKAAA